MGSKISTQTNFLSGLLPLITIGSFDGKGTFNVIKDSVELEGYIRYMTNEAKVIIEREVCNLCRGLEEQFGVTCELIYENDYPPVDIDPELTAQVVCGYYSID